MGCSLGADSTKTYGGVLSHGLTPQLSFDCRIFHEINQPAMRVTPIVLSWKPPYLLTSEEFHLVSPMLPRRVNSCSFALENGHFYHGSTWERW